jgi:excisionase family DNA binding protein
VTTIAETTLMSVRKTAAKTGISKTTLYKWVADGKLRARKVGAHMRIHVDDLAAALDALPKVGD